MRSSKDFFKPRVLTCLCRRYLSAGDYPVSLLAAAQKCDLVKLLSEIEILSLRVGFVYEANVRYFEYRTEVGPAAPNYVVIEEKLYILSAKSI